MMITIKQLIDKTGFTPLTSVPDAEITSGYVCDMLSWVMARARCGTAWVTVQSHVNVVAVAALAGCACVIVPDNIEVPAETLTAAHSNEVCILSAPCTSYGVAAVLHDLGVGEVER
jgi:hypothetical protein